MLIIILYIKVYKFVNSSLHLHYENRNDNRNRNLKMRGNNIQIIPNREIQTKISKDILREIKKAVKPYGGKVALANAAGCHKKTVFAVIKHGTASPSIIAKLQAGLAKLKEQTNQAA
jgi:hypothetical protein